MSRSWPQFTIKWFGHCSKKQKLNIIISQVDSSQTFDEIHYIFDLCTNDRINNLQIQRTSLFNSHERANRNWVRKTRVQIKSVADVCTSQMRYHIKSSVSSREREKKSLPWFLASSSFFLFISNNCRAKTWNTSHQIGMKT